MIQRILLPVAALAAAAVLGGVVAVAVWTALEDAPATPAAPAAEPAPTRPVAQAPASIADIVEQALPGVVEVRVGSAAPAEDDLPELEPGAPPRLPFPPSEGVTSAGSGFVLDGRHVVTNQHVVGSAQTATVRLHDGEELEARVVGTDPSTDVALLELPEGTELTPLPVGSSESLRIGDPVIAIGSPFGLQGTVTTGIVSARDRSIRAPNGFTIDGAIQTDAALNRGNSGGPLLDAEGRVVGMNAQIATGTGASAGIGYAIPIETVREVAAELERTGEVAHAYLGVTIQDAEERGGAAVLNVAEGSPADRAGLREGDVIVRAGGTAIESGDDLRLAVAERSPGDELELRLVRDGEERTVTVELGRRPASTE